MKKIIYGILFLAPVLATAQTLQPIVTLVGQGGHILSLLIPIAFGLAILYFFYGIAKYVLAAGDEVAAKKGKSIMIYGVVAIAVMASLFGLVTWLQNTFGVTNNATIQPPIITIPTS